MPTKNFVYKNSRLIYIQNIKSKTDYKTVTIEYNVQNPENTHCTVTINQRKSGAKYSGKASSD